jgi:hypothetical protein
MIITINFSSFLMDRSQGHSLGASWANLTYAGLLVKGAFIGAGRGTLGDLYTFGGPRTGDNTWALDVQSTLSVAAGSIWRIVQTDDPVPTIPPAKNKLVLLPGAQGPFIHLDSGIEIGISAGPYWRALLSEIDGGQIEPMQIDFMKFLREVDRHHRTSSIKLDDGSQR